MEALREKEKIFIESIEYIDVGFRTPIAIYYGKSLSTGEIKVFKISSEWERVKQELAILDVYKSLDEFNYYSFSFGEYIQVNGNGFAKQDRSLRLVRNKIPN